MGTSYGFCKQRHLVCTTLEPQFVSQFADILGTYWETIQGTSLLLIDCEEIDVITPRANASCQ